MMKYAIAAVAVASMIPAEVAAEDGMWRVGNDQIHLVYSDIDTTTFAGRATLLVRVERAAKKVCDNEIVKVIQRRCIRAAIEGAAANPRSRALRIALVENRGIPLAAR